MIAGLDPDRLELAVDPREFDEPRLPISGCFYGGLDGADAIEDLLGIRRQVPVPQSAVGEDATEIPAPELSTDERHGGLFQTRQA